MFFSPQAAYAPGRLMQSAPHPVKLFLRPKPHGSPAMFAVHRGRAWATLSCSAPSIVSGTKWFSFSPSSTECTETLCAGPRRGCTVASFGLIQPWPNIFWSNLRLAVFLTFCLRITSSEFSGRRQEWIRFFLCRDQNLCRAGLLKLWVATPKWGSRYKLAWQTRYKCFVKLRDVCMYHWYLEQWFSKWSISTPRGQLDHPRGRTGVTEWPGGHWNAAGVY